MKIEKTDAEWRAQLSPEQYRVTRCQATEPPYSGEYCDCHEEGLYRCVGCGAALFSSAHKFDSHSGWPSFRQPFEPANVGERTDYGLLMVRTEVHCSRCGAHLGHVFPDGPPPSGLRYCINSVSLSLDRSKGDGPRV